MKRLCNTAFGACLGSALLCAAAGAAFGQTVQIAAPLNGTAYQPGDVVSLTVAATGSISSVFVMGPQQLGFSPSVTGTTTFSTSITLSADLSPGTYGLMAVGIPTAGQPVYSAIVNIAVERGTAPASIMPTPSAVKLSYLGATANVHVSGTYSDGSAATLNKSSKITFVSSDPTIATVTGDGTLTAVKAGTATLTVTFGALTATVPITVVAGTPPPVCSYSISGIPSSIAASSSGISANISTSDPGCSWLALTPATWITLGNSGQGVGTGNLAVTFAANSAPAARTGAVTIASQTFSVTQAGAPCTYTVGFPITATIPAAIGSGSATVTAAAGCAWTATSDSSWFHITSGASGSGNGSVAFNIDANPGSASRMANITIAGQVFPVTQAGVPPCTYTVSFPPGTVVSAGETGTATVTTQTGCSWTASSGVAWIAITSGASGTGSGSVGFTVSANASGAQRSGTVTIAGQNTTVLQAGLGCSFLLGSAGITAPYTGGTGSVGLTASASDCTWTAVSNAPWLTVTSGASGTGNGTVGYTVGTYANVTTRNGTITIAGLTFSVTQTGVVGSVTLSPAAASPPNTGGTGTITVTANAPDFAWTAVSNATWLTVTSGASGTGNGTVGWSAAANGGSSTRTGTITIGGQTFTATQLTTAVGALLFVTSLTDQLAIIDTNSNAVLGYPPSPGFTSAVTMTPNQAQAWEAGEEDNQVYVIDAVNRSLVKTIPLPGAPRYVFFLPDGSRAYVVTESATVAIIDTATYAIIQTLDISTYDSLYQQYPPYYMCAAIMPAGDIAFLLDVKGTVTVLDTKANVVKGHFSPGTPGYDSFQWITLSPDATKAYLTDSGLTKMFVFDTRTWAPLGSVSVPGFPRGVAISPDGTKAYVANESAYVQVINLATMTVTNTIATGDNGSRGIAVSADGTKVYATEFSHVAVIDAVHNTVTTTIPLTACCAAQLTLQLPLVPLRLSASLQNATGNAGGGTFNVITLAPGTAWTAVSNASWITITSGASGTGNGTVTFTIAPNLTGAQQIGTITVAGVVYSVVQTAGQYTVTRLAGADLPSTTTGPSLSPFVTALAADPAGNVFAGTIPRAIYEMAPNGTLTRVAGDGINWYTSDGVAAVSTGLAQASGIAVDAAGNIYFSDQWDNRIRKVAAGTGIITTIAGTGTAGFSGDGGPATSAAVSQPSGVVVDSSGNVFFYDTGNNRIRRIDATTHNISTYAGNGTHGYSGEGQPATSNALGAVAGMAIDTQSNIYIAENDNYRIRKITAGTKIMTTVAGTGVQGYSNDNIAATTAAILPNAVAVDGGGNLYIADGNRVREVTASSGKITTLAGNGNYGSAGDGGPATSAGLAYPQSLTVDAAGNLFMGGSNLNGVREVTRSTGIISTVIGGGTLGDGGAATSAVLTEPVRSAVDSVGNVYIADQFGHRVRKIAAGSGTISTFAGTGLATFAGDGGPAASANLSFPFSVAVDGADNVYIGDSGNNRVRRVDVSTGIITTVAGAGPGFAGDGGPATSALFGYTIVVTVDGNGNLIVADSDNNRIRRVDAATGLVQTVAGHGVRGYSGDNGPATSASFGYLQGLAVDPAGNIFIPDGENDRIRRVDAVTHLITTIAGNGTWAWTGDGGPATAAQLGYVAGIGVTPGDDLFFGDFASNGIRRILNSTMSFVGGGNGPGDAGDGGPAPSAQFAGPFGIAIGRDGTLYVADNDGNRARKLTPPAIACPFTLDRAQQSATAVAGTYSAAVSVTGTGCNWTAVSNSSWLTVTGGANGSGNGTVTYSAAANATGAKRIGEITIAGQSLSVIQGSGAATLSIAVTHTGSFSQGQKNAPYSIVVSNAPGAGLTTGTVTVTEALPAGIILVSMAGSGWTCPAAGTTCTRSDPLGGGSSYAAITVTVDVLESAGTPLTNQATVSGGGSVSATASDVTAITPLSSSACDVNGDGAMNVADVQLGINEALGVVVPTHDLNHDGVVNVADVQLLINAALGLGCTG